MANVLIVAYLLIVLALIVVILLQRSEGGALGIGGGSGGGLVTARGSANLLSRTTAILAALFMSVAIALSIVADLDRGTDDILNNAATATPDAQTTVLDALNELQGETAGDNALPVPGADGDAPAQNSGNPAAVDPALPVPGAPAPGTGGSN